MSSADGGEAIERPRSRPRSGEYQKSDSYRRTGEERGWHTDNHKEYQEYIEGNRPDWKEKRDWVRENSVNDEGWKNLRTKKWEESKTSQWSDHGWVNFSNNDSGARGSRDDPPEDAEETGSTRTPRSSSANQGTSAKAKADPFIMPKGRQPLINPRDL